MFHGSDCKIRLVHKFCPQVEINVFPFSWPPYRIFFFCFRSTSFLSASLTCHSLKTYFWPYEWLCYNVYELRDQSICSLAAAISDLVHPVKKCEIYILSPSMTNPSQKTCFRNLFATISTRQDTSNSSDLSPTRLTTFRLPQKRYFNEVKTFYKLNHNNQLIIDILRLLP